VSKGDANTLSDIKYWRYLDYLVLLEQIILENDRKEQQAKKVSKKRK